MGEGGLSPQYFFHALTLPEAEDYIKGQDRRHRQGWEQARFSGSLFVKALTGEAPTINFPWDDDNTNTEFEQNQEDWDKLEELTKQFNQQIQNGKSNTLENTLHIG